MAGRQVSSSDISVGLPLPWDVFDANGLLLLRRGYVIETARALERLVGDGLFIEAGDNGGRRSESSSLIVQASEQPSALQYLNDARRLIGPATQNLESIQDFPDRVRRIANLIDLACSASADVAIASILLLQDESYVIRHHINTAIISNLMGRAMSLAPEAVRSLTAAALTMNISMYEVQDKLHGVSGQLNDKLRAFINGHPQQSQQRLRKLGVTDDYWLRCVAQHHEREDGGGYPQGLPGTDIEEGAKILALSDRYCARVSIRHYRPVLQPNVALRDLYIDKGAEISPVVAAYLFRIVGLYPPGCIVRLRNSEIAIVVERTDNPDTPLAYAVLGPSGAALSVPSVRRTIREAYRIQDVLTIDKIDFPIQMSRLWGNAARVN